MITEAKKYHNLPSASCRFRKAGGNIQSELKASALVANGINSGLSLKALEWQSQCWRAREDGHLKLRQRAFYPYSASGFYSTLHRLMISSDFEQRDLFSPGLLNQRLETSSQTHSEILFLPVISLKTHLS